MVGYFYRQAVNSAPADAEVDEAPYRYPGRKPSTKEMAVLMLADCCEGASRAAAQHDRNLTKADLEAIVRGLFADRVDDGQLDESSLTFRELKTAEEAFIEALVGFYHPRIMYPTLASEPAKDGAAADAATTTAAPAESSATTPPATESQTGSAASSQGNGEPAHPSSRRTAGPSGDERRG